MSKKKIPAAEFAAMLADPEFVAARERDADEHARRVAELHRAEAPLVEELRNAGIPVLSAGDLANRPGSYPKAVPILLAHLPRAYPPYVREVIARALAFPEAIAIWQELKTLYRDERDEQVKDGLAVAVAAASNDDVVADVIALARDSTLGSSRLLLLDALECSADPRARAALMSLGTDPDLSKEIPVILKRLARRNARRSKR